MRAVLLLPAVSLVQIVEAAWEHTHKLANLSPNSRDALADLRSSESGKLAENVELVISVEMTRFSMELGPFDGEETQIGEVTVIVIVHCHVGAHCDYRERSSHDALDDVLDRVIRSGDVYRQ